MPRNLEDRLRRLEQAAAEHFENRADVHDQYFRDWLTRVEGSPWLALYPNESAAREAQKPIRDRLHDLARRGHTAADPPPEFRPDAGSKDRRLAWLISSDPELSDLFAASDLSERVGRITRGEPPAGPREPTEEET